MSPQEALEAIHIVDIGPRHLEGITPENFRSILETGKALLTSNRQALLTRYFADSPTLPDAFFRCVYNVAPHPHAIQCTANGREDKLAFLEYLNQSLPDGDRRRRLNEIIDTSLTLGQTLQELLEVDIARRIGLAKQDEGFIRRELPLLEADIIPKITAFLWSVIRNSTPENRDNQTFARAVADARDITALRGTALAERIPDLCTALGSLVENYRDTHIVEMEQLVRDLA